MPDHKVTRRDFMKTTASAGAGLTVLRGVKVNALGANGRINVAIIGVGGRGRGLLDWVMKTGQQTENPAQVVAVSDVYGKRLRAAKEAAKCEGYLDYREALNRKDIDAVVIATPDHWHARMAIEAMERGKDVYLEKPMTHTVEEAKRVYEKARETNRVLQVGSQTTSSDQWHKARKAIADGMIGQLLMSQGSYHRTSTGGEWNWPIDLNAGPDKTGDDFIDWKMWLGDAPRRPYNADRFFRFRKYWDYSGGIATDLFYHVMAPLNVCWGEAQFPYRVAGTGGIYVFKDEREVPDTFMLTADFSAGHSVVLSSSMANETHIPGLIRGREGTIMMVPSGRFEDKVEFITVTASRVARSKFEEKYGANEVKLSCEPREDHMQNFLRCVRSRQKPVLDALTAYKAMATIGMSVQSYREGRMLYWDQRKQKVVHDPPRS